MATDQSDPLTPDAAMKALAKLFSAPRVINRAHFRYRIDGPTETEKALDAAMEEAFGPDWNKKHESWVRPLRRLGLIG
jgi:hypothetical protein